MIVTEVQFKTKTKTKKQNRPIVCTKSLIPWVNRGPSAQSTSPTSPRLPVYSCLLFILLLSPWLPYRNPKRSSPPLSQALCTCCCSLPGVFYPWLLAGLPMLLPPWVLSFLIPFQAKASFLWKSLSEHSTFPLPCMSHNLKLRVYFLHFFLIFWIDCTLLKSKDYVSSNSPLQPHCPEQGLTHI